MSLGGALLWLRLRLRPSPLHQPEQQRPGEKDSSGACKGCYFSAALPPLPPPPPPLPSSPPPPPPPIWPSAHALCCRRSGRECASRGGSSPVPTSCRDSYCDFASHISPAARTQSKYQSPPQPPAFFVRIFPQRRQRHLAPP